MEECSAKKFGFINSELMKTFGFQDEDDCENEIFSMLSRSNRGTPWSKGGFEWRISIGSEIFSLFICLDANKCVLLTFFTLKEATCAKFGQNHRKIMQKVHFRSRLRVVPRFPSGIVEWAKRERAWKSPHARKGGMRREERKMIEKEKREKKIACSTNVIESLWETKGKISYPPDC